MAEAVVEHVNVTVRDADKLAEQLCDIFGWHIRWRGDATRGGKTIHIGGEQSYVALYQNEVKNNSNEQSYYQINGLNHIGIVVENLTEIEDKVRARGFKPHLHGDYEPGRRFYFDGPEGLEIEVVSYSD